MADFVNRRLALGPMDSDPSKAKEQGLILYYDLSDWSKYPEDRILHKACVGQSIYRRGFWTNDPQAVRVLQVQICKYKE